MTSILARFHVVAFAGILAAGLIAFGASTSAQAQGTPAIGVTVDGNQISFPGTQPIELHGSVLVPLRGVFQALGARVDYDPQTQIVTAHKSGRTIVVPIGSSTATINGQPQQLSVPAQVMNGSTLVPLRFVAEALGDYVEWGDQTHMVTITSGQQPPHVAFVPHHDGRSPGIGDTGAVVGVVRHVDMDSTPPKLIVRIGGQDSAIPVGHDATILRGHFGHDGHPVGLSDIQPGDRIIVHENGNGFAVRLMATY